MSIALWYCPPSGSVAYEILSQLISSLQTMFPNSPLFEPHITIATQLLCIDKDARNQVLTSCVAAIQSINKELIKNGKRDPLVSFKSCSIGKKFFKKVTLDCNENKYLMSIAKIIQEMYSDTELSDSTDSFHPHVSLLYSDVKPMSKAYSRIIQQRVQDTLDIELDEVEVNDENTQMSWDVNSKNVISWNIPGTFKIVNCEGPIEQWEVLGSVDV
ncbi:2',3'-cyclic-nucleotide 3'-phosphodiesterase [Monosporozyma unispora]|nr:2',3'-cyclic nucleotide 3'-phosphodiesterase [Kazachstania unispora]